MATKTEIADQVDILSAGYGRSVEKNTYEAYHLALADVEADYLRRGVTAVIREQLQFMPTPAQVRAFAMKAKHEDARYRKQTDRRLHCLRCMDAGVVFIIHPQWLIEYQREITPDWFVTGWRREAMAWCKNTCSAGFLVGVVCGCDCPNSQIYYRQLEAKREDPKKFAAFPQVFVEDRHCLVEGGMEGTQEALLKWIAEGRDARRPASDLPNYEPAFEGMDQHWD